MVLVILVVVVVFVASVGDTTLGTSTHCEAKSKWVGGSTAKSESVDDRGGGDDKGERQPRWEKTVCE